MVDDGDFGTVNIRSSQLFSNAVGRQMAVERGAGLTRQLLAFSRGQAFATRAAELGGYDIAGLGAVHLNGP